MNLIKIIKKVAEINPYLFRKKVKPKVKSKPSTSSPSSQKEGRWLSPKGKMIKLKPEETHKNWIETNENMSMEEAFKNKWIRVSFNYSTKNVNLQISPEGKHNNSVKNAIAESFPSALTVRVDMVGKSVTYDIHEFLTRGFRAKPLPKLARVIRKVISKLKEKNV